MIGADDDLVAEALDDPHQRERVPLHRGGART